MRIRTDPISCPECGFIAMPSVIQNHLIEDHLYSVAETEGIVNERRKIA